MSGFFWSWCLAHRLQLAVKNALKNTAFDSVDDMLLRLYYLYEKAPKKCRELHEIVSDLRGCISLDENGVKSNRASGSRWVNHKLNAMRHILSKYGAYTSYLMALSEDRSIKSFDRVQFRGYYNQWLHAKYHLLGCAVFVDILTPCAIFSKVMLSDELNILSVLSSLLRTVTETDKLSTLPLAEWPVYSATLKKIGTENGNQVYQCQELKHFSDIMLEIVHVVGVGRSDFNGLG